MEILIAHLLAWTIASLTIYPFCEAITIKPKNNDLIDKIFDGLWILLMFPAYIILHIAILIIFLFAAIIIGTFV